MKKIIVLVCILYSVLCIPTFAVTYCATSSWGYAGTVTGGGDATPTLVKNETELKNALKNNNKVIIITQDITVSGQISTDKSNLTIMALPGARLINNTQTKDGSGILYLRGSNLLLRNLTFEGPGAYDCDGKDNLTLNGAKNVWVDHCDFQDGIDGNFDINGTADNITVSWCRFRYLKEPKSGGSGGAADHRFSNLVGSGSSDKPSDGTYNITFAYCWWDSGCKQRMTRCRNASQHFLNCYWNSSVADYYIGPENADCYIEGCYIEGKPAKDHIFYQNYGGTNGAKFVNCTSSKGVPADVTGRTVLTPTYTYTALTAAEAKAAVTHSTCGAGATLTVTTAGAVSSSCDGDTPIDPQPQDTIVVDGDCCVNLGLGEAPTVSNSGIPSDFALLSVTANMTKSTWDQGFLNLGGNADYITFDFSAYDATIEAVEFDVTIPKWEATKNTIAYHWNNEQNSSYSISSADTETVQLTAPANAKSFTIQRSAGTSTRIAQVCFQIKSTPTDIETVSSDSKARKIIREGRLLILRDNKTYTVLGLSL